MAKVRQNGKSASNAAVQDLTRVKAGAVTKHKQPKFKNTPTGKVALIGNDHINGKKKGMKNNDKKSRMMKLYNEQDSPRKKNNIKRQIQASEAAGKGTKKLTKSARFDPDDSVPDIFGTSLADDSDDDDYVAEEEEEEEEVEEEYNSDANDADDTDDEEVEVNESNEEDEEDVEGEEDVESEDGEEVEENEQNGTDVQQKKGIKMFKGMSPKEDESDTDDSSSSLRVEFEDSDEASPNKSSKKIAKNSTNHDEDEQESTDEEELATSEDESTENKDAVNSEDDEESEDDTEANIVARCKTKAIKSLVIEDDDDDDDDDDSDYDVNASYNDNDDITSEDDEQIEEEDADDDDDDDDDDEDEDAEGEEEAEDEEEEDSAPGLKALLGNSLVDDDDDDEDFNSADEDDEDDDISDEDEDEEESNNVINTTSNKNAKEGKQKSKQQPEEDSVDKKLLTPEEQLELNKRTIFIGNLPTDTTRAQLRKVFVKFGPIENLRLRGAVPADPKMSKKAAAITKKMHEKLNSICAYIAFKSQTSAKEALSMNGKLFDGNYMRVDSVIGGNQRKYDPKKAVFLGNLPLQIDDNTIWKFFSDCGEILSVHVIRDHRTRVGKGIGYVNFKSEDSVPIALELDRSKIDNREVRIKRCTPQKQNDKEGKKRHRSEERDSSPKKFKKASGGSVPSARHNQENAIRRTEMKIRKVQSAQKETEGNSNKTDKGNESFQGRKADVKKKGKKPNKVEKQKKIMAAKLTKGKA